MNLIPEGSLHARKHNLDIDGITKKGIPVVSEEIDGVSQHAEIEVNEIILHKELTERLEKLKEKYDKAASKKEKDEIATLAGTILS